MAGHLDSNNSEVVYRPIGVIHTPYATPQGTPIQPVAAASNAGIVEVFAQYAEGLHDIDGFSHIILLFHLHKAKQGALKVVPFLDDSEHGVFATRSPSRPNAIGFSVVELVKVEGNRLFVSGVDILDGTPLLDIKPFVPAFDVREATKTGWFQHAVHQLNKVTDDGRFC